MRVVDTHTDILRAKSAIGNLARHFESAVGSMPGCAGQVVMRGLIAITTTAWLPMKARSDWIRIGNSCQSFPVRRVATCDARRRRQIDTCGVVPTHFDLFRVPASRATLRR